MSDQGSSTPPCWAADPSGRHRFRYWDGMAWTGHVFDGEVPPATAPGPAPTRPAPPPAIAAQPSEAEAGRYVVASRDEQPVDADEERGARQRHDSPRSRRSFWTGALAGGLVVAILAAIAWVTLGGSSSSRTTVAAPATTTTSLDATSTTLTSSSSAATSSTAAPGTARPPAQVRVDVLNGSGTAGAAETKATALKAAGYTVTGTGNTAARQGTVVVCKTGFDAEAAALAHAVGSNAKAEPFPTPPPAGSTNADCVVMVGS